MIKVAWGDGGDAEALTAAKVSDVMRYNMRAPSCHGQLQDHIIVSIFEAGTPEKKDLLKLTQPGKIP